MWEAWSLPSMDSTLAACMLLGSNSPIASPTPFLSSTGLLLRSMASSGWGHIYMAAPEPTRHRLAPQVLTMGVTSLL